MNFIFNLKCWMIRNSSLSSFCLFIWPVIQILSPSLPLLFSSRLGKRLIVFGKWRQSRPMFASQTKLFKTWIYLQILIVDNLFLYFRDSFLLLRNQVLCPFFPFLITFWVDYIFNRRLILSEWMSILDSWMIWKSGLSTLSLFVGPIIEILSPCLPLFFSSWLS